MSWDSDGSSTNSKTSKSRSNPNRFVSEELGTAASHNFRLSSSGLERKKLHASSSAFPHDASHTKTIIEDVAEISLENLPASHGAHEPSSNASFEKGTRTASGISELDHGHELRDSAEHLTGSTDVVSATSAGLAHSPSLPSPSRSSQLLTWKPGA